MGVPRTNAVEIATQTAWPDLTAEVLRHTEAQRNELRIERDNLEYQVAFLEDRLEFMESQLDLLVCSSEGSASGSPIVSCIQSTKGASHTVERSPTHANRPSISSLSTSDSLSEEVRFATVSQDRYGSEHIPLALLRVYDTSFDELEMIQKFLEKQIPVWRDPLSPHSSSSLDLHQMMKLSPRSAPCTPRASRRSQGCELRRIEESAGSDEVVRPSRVDYATHRRLVARRCRSVECTAVEDTAPSSPPRFELAKRPCIKRPEMDLIMRQTAGPCVLQSLMSALVPAEEGHKGLRRYRRDSSTVQLHL